MEKILVIGSSGHARVVIDIIEKEGKYEIAGCIDSFRSKGERTYDYEVLGNENDISELVVTYNITGYIVAIGDNWARSVLREKISLLKTNIKLISAIHPSVQIGKNVKIGYGTVLMPGVVVNSNAIIGDCCLLNTCSSLDHDSIMENFSSLAPHATTGGSVRIGEFSSVSLSSCISNKVKIGKHSIIGAGSVVFEDIPDFKLAFGTPAKVIRDREIGEKYV